MTDRARVGVGRGRRRRRRLPPSIPFAASALWLGVAWGGRISLLTEAERFDLWNWTRIGGSLLMGVVLLWVALFRPPAPAPRRVAWTFLVFSLALWGRSLVMVWTEPANSLAFNLVHTGLALVTWALAGACVRSS